MSNISIQSEEQFFVLKYTSRLVEEEKIYCLKLWDIMDKKQTETL